MQGSVNSFFRFVLGFTTFIAVSMGLTYAVTTYSIAQEQKRQTAAAFQIFLGHEEKASWWDVSRFWR